MKGILISFLMLFLCLNFSYSKKIKKEIGIVSFYGKKHNGKKTASGEKFDMNSYTAAHRSLKFGTFLKVTNLSNKKYVVVKVNDRGPFSSNRILDLSESASKKIGNFGLAKCKIEVINNSGTFE